MPGVGLNFSQVFLQLILDRVENNLVNFFHFCSYESKCKDTPNFVTAFLWFCSYESKCKDTPNFVTAFLWFCSYESKCKDTPNFVTAFLWFCSYEIRLGFGRRQLGVTGFDLGGWEGGHHSRNAAMNGVMSRYPSRISLA